MKQAPARYAFPRWFFPLMVVGIVGVLGAVAFFLAEAKYVLAGIAFACAIGATASFVRFWRRRAIRS
jgi:hypothetical protein